jgi:hypothetical protein
MRWFRSNSRWGAAGAYLALAIQFALSFGHLHITSDSGLPHAAPLPVQSAGNALDFGGGPKPERQQPSDKSCPICISILIGGSFLPAAVPSLSVPMVATPIRPASTTDHGRVLSLSLPFRARAPPVA